MAGDGGGRVTVRSDGGWRQAATGAMPAGARIARGPIFLFSAREHLADVLYYTLQSGVLEARYSTKSSPLLPERPKYAIGRIALSREIVKAEEGG